MKMKTKRMLSFFLALAMIMAYLPLKPIVSYADDNVNDGVKIDDDKNFPDKNFRGFVKQYDTDHNGNLSEGELDAVTKINVSNRSVTSLKGIEHFKNLKELYCYNNRLTTLDVSKNTNLSTLWCNINKLTKLDLSYNSNLTNLVCGDNNITELNVSGNQNLKELQCDKNKLTKLNVSNNTSLTKFYCTRNNLTELDLSHNPNLTNLMCAQNNLKSLDVGKNTELTELRCNDNKLKELDVRENINLNGLWCSGNELTSLDLSNNTNLTQLDCHNNQLKSLDVGKNTELDSLDCSSNKLASLDVGKNTKLEELNCSSNKLASLDVGKNTKLEELNCSSNKLASLDLSKIKGHDLLHFNFAENPLTSIKMPKNVFIDPSMFPSVKYTVTVEKGSKKVPFSKLPQDFDKSRIKSDVQRDEDGFTWDGSTNPIKFRYQLCENPTEVANLDNLIVDAEITVTEVEFNPGNVIDMSVATDPKLDYTEGESLDLSDLVVTLEDNNHLTIDVPFADFGSHGITTTLENGKRLTAADHTVDGTITYTAPNGHPTSLSCLFNITVNKVYTVTYTDGAHGKYFANQVKSNLTYGANTPAFTGTPTRDGYVFAGWTPDPAGTKVTKDVTYVAQWKKDSFTVTFKDGVNQIASVKVETGQAIATDNLPEQSMPANPTKDGYIFKEWNTRSDGKGETFTGTSVVNSDMTVYAIYTEDLDPQPKTPDSKTQHDKHSDVIPQTGESASFAGLLAALGFSITGLAILRKKKMMKENK